MKTKPKTPHRSPNQSSLLMADETQDISMLSNNQPNRPFYERIPCLKPLLFILLIQVLIFILCYFFVPQHQILKIIADIKYYLETYYNKNYVKFLIYYFVLCFISISCFLPTISLTTILFTMITRKILFTWVITLLFYILIEFLLFFIIHYFFKNKLKTYLQHYR